MLPALDAVRDTLACLAARPGARRRDGVARTLGHRAIARAQQRIFGADPQGPRTRIMMTMPAEAATNRALVRRMLEAGGDCARDFDSVT